MTDTLSDTGYETRFNSEDSQASASVQEATHVGKAYIETPPKQLDLSAADQTEPDGASQVPKLPFDFADQHYTEHVYAQIMQACRSGRDPRGVDLDMAKSIWLILQIEKPKDPTELILVLQITRLHEEIMKTFGLLGLAKTAAEIELRECMLNKLLRTCLACIDTHHRCYRSHSEPKFMIQQNLSVGEGGQAIVANVAQNPGIEAKPIDRPAMIADESGARMSIVETDEQSLPGPIVRRRRSSR
jgi:hypothetical protein